MQYGAHQKQLVQTDAIDWTRVLLVERIAELESMLEWLEESADHELVELRTLLEQNISQTRRLLEDLCGES